MHTDYTLAILDSETKAIGEKFDKFVDKTCTTYSTKELKSEVEAPQRRQAKKATAAGSSGSGASKGSALSKKFNRQTYKYHALGDYVKMIRRFGTTDSVSMQPVRLQWQLHVCSY